MMNFLETFKDKGEGPYSNEVLKKHGIYTKKEVKKCLTVYRKMSRTYP